jgi:hypothetical protein
MTGFDPRDKNFEARVRTGFARQTAMATLEHDPEKWKPVFRNDHAQTKRQSGMTIRR